MSSIKLSWNYKDGFIFFLEDEGRKLDYVEWYNYTDKAVSELSILSELIDNGLGIISDQGCFVESIEVLKLSEVDKLILGLPEPYPYDIYIQAEGQLNDKTFVFKYGFYDFFPHGNKLDIRRSGPLVLVEDRQYLLSANQYKVCMALDGFNSLPNEQRIPSTNYKSFGDIKMLSKEAACLLDSYLDAENVYVPDRIKVEIKNVNGSLELIPDMEIESSGFLRNFDLFNDVRDTYRVEDSNGNPVRIVIDEGIKEELRKIKSKRVIKNKEEVISIVEQPELYFESSKVDLSVFYSERVKEIGFYKPKFYPFVCPYKSEWIPGLEIRDKVEGTKRIYLNDEDELNEFANFYNDALKNSFDSFEFNGSAVNIDAAAKVIELARKARRSSSVDDKKVMPDFGPEVLIIHENAEILGYSETREVKDSIDHTFYPIANLEEEIELKNHQVEGVAWLQSLYFSSVRGCLLADDMGLGKTLQLLYFIEWHAQFNPSNKPYLIVAPVALLENWQNEYNRFFPSKSLDLMLLNGSIGLRKDFNEEDLGKLQRRQLILTNYETLRAYQFTLCAVDYSIVVLDEAQKIKTPGTQITNVSKAIKADFKIAMTGTPVENTLVDLWCIMDFSVPGLLGNAKDFARKYQNPLNHTEVDLKVLGDQLRSEIGVFLKRRLKSDVAKELPPKHDNKYSRIIREMPPIQWERYKTQIELAKAEGLEGIERRDQILRSLWAIRDISDHPFLISEQISSYSSEELIETSAKLQILVDLLSTIKEKEEKAIIFADRKETQKMLQKVVYEIYGFLPRIINGDTPTTSKETETSKLSRQQAIDQFQNTNGFNVIVMSQLAAGVGLNVTKANHVVHYSRHWNPAKEEQATDRAYRIGQDKEVFVYYPMAVFPKGEMHLADEQAKSFDEILDNLLQSKKNLATSTLFPTEQAEVTPDDLFASVFDVNSGHSHTPITIDTVDKLNPNLFEAFVAAMYKVKGYEVYLTPNSNDKGADVVAISDSDCLLLQAKQTRYAVGVDAVREIMAANLYYARKFNRNFTSAVISNGKFGQSAISISEPNNVILIGRKEVLMDISKYKITMKDILFCNQTRVERV